ncbi:MAG: hypothetical protein M3125_05950 [Gemmatimonadota bacterium]|nr:hypothetical protein [Gemmatimonadota bacterium]
MFCSPSRGSRSRLQRTLSAYGQGDGDVIAHLALITTPAGGFVPVPIGAQLTPSPRALALRYGHLRLDDDDAFHGIGVTGQFRGVAGQNGGP